MLFLKPDVTKKNRELFFLEGFVWSHQSITGLISQRQFVPKCQFLACRPLGCCSFQNILTNPIISQTDTLLPPYIISYYSSAFTIISTTTTPKCTLRFLTCHCTTACSTVYSKSVLLEWTYLQLIVTRARQSLDYSARMTELVPCREFSI